MCAAPIGNLFALGNKGGRPAFFESPEDLQKRIVEYFESYINKDVESGQQITPVLGYKPTVTGLALWLGFNDRQSLYDYKKKEEFSCIIKKACLYIEMNYEQLLESKGATGAIFALKNMGWKDKTEVHNKVEEIVPLSPEEIKKANQQLEDEY